MWDEKQVQAYQEWLMSPAGELALRQKKRLLEHMISGWSRRGRSLLDIGCGVGYFLEVLWEAGFTVTGLDRSLAMLDTAYGRMGHRATLDIGTGEYLPYPDKEFDYAVLFTSLNFMESPNAALEEAFRVASRGVLVSFLNSWSLQHTFRKRQPAGISGCAFRDAQWFSPAAMRALLRTLVGDKPMVMRSMLGGSAGIWRNSRRCVLRDGWISPLPLGCFTTIRVDLVEESPLTPVFIKPLPTG